MHYKKVLEYLWFFGLVSTGLFLFVTREASSSFVQGEQSAGSFADFTFTMRPASGARTTGETVGPITNTAIFDKAEITLDITTLTLADSDDKVCFYAQTTYGGGFWTDVESICFTDADDGTTARRVIAIDSAKDGPGTIQSITGTDPAAGSEISETVPANTIWLLKSVRFTLVTDATPDTRQVHLVLDDGTTTLLNLPTTGTQIVSLTRNYNAHELGGLIVPTGNEIDIGLPSDVILPSGYRLVTETTLLKAGDNFGAPQLSVTAWHDPLSSTDGTIGDNLKSYDRPIGSQIRLRVIVTGATAPTYAYSAFISLKASQ